MVIPDRSNTHSHRPRPKNRTALLAVPALVAILLLTRQFSSDAFGAPRPLRANPDSNEAPSLPALPKPLVAGDALELVSGYIAYSTALWHEEAPGGYWGDGIGHKDGNGATRASNSILLGHALLAYAEKTGWLTAAEAKTLEEAGLNRAGLVRRVEAGIVYIAAHHVSANAPLEPKWGNTWQSSLWVAAAVEAAMLVWEDLSPAAREAARRMPIPEADRIAAAPPRNYSPGNTGAEENGWDTHALACALALNPDHPNANTWWNALKRYSVNTYSKKTDMIGDRAIGEDRLRDLVTTANIFEDHTLENHNFLHPDYIQVSGQELGEAWMILALGDALFGGDRAARFKPYALHNVEPVWRNVMRSLLLPTGDLLFPNGNDWTLFTSMHPAYYAWIAAGVGDPVALAAETRFIRSAQRRRDASTTPGRIFEDFNMEWWWEPLFVKRQTSALLVHALAPSAPPDATAFDVLDRGEWTTLFPDGHVWIHRNANYAASVSWGRIHIGTLTPFGPGHLANPYMTLPTTDSILPDDVRDLREIGESGGAHVAVLGRADGGKCAVVCLPNSVVWLSPVPFRPLGIQNDELSGTGRVLVSESGETEVPALIPKAAFAIPGRWVSIDRRFALIAGDAGFEYTPAGKYNQRSVAVDRIRPSSGWAAWQMIPAVDPDVARKVAAEYKVEYNGTVMDAEVRDGATGLRYRIRATLTDTAIQRMPVTDVLLSGKAEPDYPPSRMTDGSRDTFAVLQRADGTGPTLADPILVEFTADNSAGVEATLVVTPRPGYGPPDIELQRKTSAGWSSLGRRPMAGDPIHFPLPEGVRWRLVLTSSFDPKNRNTQIAEIHAEVGRSKSPAADSASEPGKLVSVRVDPVEEP